VWVNMRSANPRFAGKIQSQANQFSSKCGFVTINFSGQEGVQHPF